MTTQQRVESLQSLNIPQQVSRSSLLEYHQQQLDNNQNNDDQSSELLDVLGGVDHILHEYLQNNTIQLTDEQLTNIHQIITPSTDTKIMSQTTTISVPVHNQTITKLPTGVLLTKSQTILNPSNSVVDTLEDDYDKSDAFYYVFDENMTYLHKYFGYEWAQKLLSILHHKIMEIMMGLTMALYLVLLVGYFGTILYALYTIICSLLLWIPFCCVWLLSVNIEGRRIVCKSFEFWFKIVYAFGHMITINIINYGYESDSFEIPYLSMIATSLIGIVIILAIAVMGLFDAVKMNKIWKIIVSGLCAVIAIMWTVLQQMNAYQEGDVYMEIGGGVGFSLTSIQISTTRVLAIFLTKQAYNTWKRSKKNKCVSMKYTPFIKWINSKDVNDDKEQQEL